MKIIKGDLIKLTFQGKFNVIAHGANCFNTMGAGIAKSIKEYFPKAYRADVVKYHTTTDNTKQLGKYSKADYKNFNNTIIELTVLNLYTQYEPGRNFHLDYLKLSLTKALEDGVISSKSRIGLPKIGCGIGGGNWEEVEEFLIDFEDSHNLDITVVHYFK